MALQANPKISTASFSIFCGLTISCGALVIIVLLSPLSARLGYSRSKNPLVYDSDGMNKNNTHHQLGSNNNQSQRHEYVFKIPPLARAECTRHAPGETSHQEDDKTHRLSLLEEATFTPLLDFLQATPQTVTSTAPPQFLTDVKNPCFALDRNYVNVGNISLDAAVEMNYDVRCLPYVYLAGFSKCGSTDLHFNLIKHQLLFALSPNRKKPNNGLRIGDKNYRSIKETHFWDNRRCVKHLTLENFTNQMSAEAIVESHRRYGNSSYSLKNRDDFRQMLYLESTPRQVWHHDSWNEERVHWGMLEPVEFTPDRIHHATPDARLIFLLRDPVERTFSDYRFVTAGWDYRSAEDFHRKVVAAIEWWGNCTGQYTERTCSYGPAPPGLPFHNSPSCGSKAFVKNSSLLCTPYRVWGCGNAIDRFRISLYYVYLAEWLRAFPGEHMLFIRTEEMMQDRMAVIQRIIKFLRLPALRTDVYERLRQLGTRVVLNKSRTDITMLNETRQALEVFFRPANRKLQDLLKLEEPLWRYHSV